MPEKPIEDDAPVDRRTEEERDNGVLNFFFCDSLSYPWSVEEIAREIGHYNNAVDSVRRLTEAGLLHRIGDFAFPTRTARRADQLGVGGV